jgi:nuclease S1
MKEDRRGEAPGTRGRAMKPSGSAAPRGRIRPLAALLWLTMGGVIASSPGSALAWGRLGHRASARLAESRLSPAARAIVRDLLEPGNR